MKLLLFSLFPLVYSSLLPYHYHEGWVVFTDIHNDHHPHMTLKLIHDVQIHLTNEASVNNYIYEVYLKNFREKGIGIDVYNSDGDKIYYKEFPEQNNEKRDKIINLKWDSQTLDISHGSTLLFTHTDKQMINITNVAIYPHPTVGLNYNNTYTFITNMKEGCKDSDTHEYYLTCNLTILPEKKIPNNTGSQLQAIMKSTFFKSTNLFDKYITRIVLNVTEKDPTATDLDNTLVHKRNSYFSVIKNENTQIKTPGYFFLGTSISLRTDFDEGLVFINNNNDDSHPAILWTDQDPNYNFKNFDYIVVQNLIHRDNTIFENKCKLICTNPRNRNILKRLGYFIFQTKSSAQKYCDSLSK